MRRYGDLDGEKVLAALEDIAFRDGEAKVSERMKALELLGKHLGLWKEEPPADGLGEEISRLEELLAQRRRRQEEAT